MIDQFEESLKALKTIESFDIMHDDSYQGIVKLISEKIIIPYVTHIIPIGRIFYRARMNENCSFTLKKEISYNKNIDSIKIGRANYFHQSIFYASHKEETAIFETSQSIKNREKVNNEVITVGKWIVIKPIKVIAIFHDNEFLQKDKLIRENYLKFLKTDSRFTSKRAQTHLEFISNQFAKKVSCIDEYKVSCAFFNILKDKKFEEENISGVLFPTVEWKKNDLNVALTPECVENNLALNQVAEFKINIEENHNGIIQTGISDCLTYEINDFSIKG